MGRRGFSTPWPPCFTYKISPLPVKNTPCLTVKKKKKEDRGLAQMIEPYNGKYG